MEEQIWLSSEEVNMLKEPDMLLDSIRRKRIIAKVEKCVSTLEYVARYDKIPFEQLWKEQTTQINSFLTRLIRYDPTDLPSDNRDKLGIAGDLIKSGLNYYTSAFKNSKFFKLKIKEVQELITTINELNQHNAIDEKHSLLYTMRKQNSHPPNLEDIGGRNDYASYCVLCFKASSGKNKIESIKKIRHHSRCYYDRKFFEIYMVTREPKIKTL